MFGDDPTSEEIIQIRSKVQDYIVDNGKEIFDPRDVDRLTYDDNYVKRFYKHVFEQSGSQVENAVKMVIKSFSWRMELNVRNIDEFNVSEVLKKKGALFAHNHDKDGKQLLIFSVRNHIKGTESMTELKKFLIYYLERLDREGNGEEITVFFDCASAGLKNMDMEFIQYMINVFKEYYPWFLNYILVFEMPWILNAAWKLIKSWLPASAIEKIKFLTKSNIGEYIDEDQSLTSWGGLDDWEYTFESEKLKEKEGEKIVSTKTESKDMPQHPVEVDAMHNGNVDKSRLILVEPSNTITFTPTRQGDLQGSVKVTNISSQFIIYKIKTTSPEKYRVRPTIALLKSNASLVVEITVPCTKVTSSQDKFLITAVSVNDGNISTCQMSEIMRTSEPEDECRLRCTIDDSVTKFGTEISDKLAKSSEESSGTSSETISKEIFALKQGQQDLLNELRSIKTQINIFLYLFSFFVVMFFLYSVVTVIQSDDL